MMISEGGWSPLLFLYNIKSFSSIQACYTRGPCMFSSFCSFVCFIFRNFIQKNHFDIVGKACSITSHNQIDYTLFFSFFFITSIYIYIYNIPFFK